MKRKNVLSSSLAEPAQCVTQLNPTHTSHKQAKRPWYVVM